MRKKLNRCLGLFVLVSFSLWGNPKGAEVVSGEVSFRHEGNVLRVQTGDRSIIKWDTFSIAKGEATQFVQPSVDSIVFNRVSNELSRIDGVLEANGNVYLFNPRGVVVGPEGQVITNGFLATTLDTENAAFLQGDDLLFSGNSAARVVNLGRIQAKGGDVFLFARRVENQGEITAPEGVVGLGSAARLYLKMEGPERIFIAPELSLEEEEDAGIDNPGVITALQAELKAEGNPFRFAINHSGVIEACSTREEGGRIYLVSEGGGVQTEGKLCAEKAGRKGGTVHVLGEKVLVAEGSEIDVSGDFGGGRVLIGGDFQGSNPEISNAQTSVVESGVTIDCSALVDGDGGRVIVWADGCTAMRGEIAARGGEVGGDGGFVEVSAHDGLEFTGLVDTQAPCGKTGDLLLDPSDINISNAANSNIKFSGTEFIQENPSSTPSNLNVATLEVQLLSTNVTVATTPGSDGDGDITVEDDITSTSTNTLILNADQDVTIDTLITMDLGGPLLINAGRDIAIGAGAILDLDSILFINAGRNFTMGDLSTAITCTNLTALTNLGSTILRGTITGTGGTFSFTSGIDIVFLGIKMTNTGPISFDAATNLTTTSGITDETDISATTGALTFKAGDEFLIPMTVAGMTGNFFATGDSIDITTGTNILFGTDGGVGGAAIIFKVVETDLNISCGGNFLMFASTPAGAFDTPIFFQMAGKGTHTIDVSGDLVLQAGGVRESPVAFFPNATPITNRNDMIFTVGGDTTLSAGTDEDAFAHIGPSFANTSGGSTGDITLSTGGDLVLSGSFISPVGLTPPSAQIGLAAIDGLAVPAASFTGVGNVTVNVDGDVTLEGNLGGAFIGYGSVLSGITGTEEYTGNVSVTADGIVKTDASAISPGQAWIGAGPSSTSSSTTINSDLVSVTGSSLCVEGGTGSGGFGSSAAYVGILTDVSTLGTMSSVTTSTTGNTEVFSGIMGGEALIGAFVDGEDFFANVSVTAGGAVVLAPDTTAGAEPASIITGDVAAGAAGNINILAENIAAGTGATVPLSAQIVAGQNIGAIANVNINLSSVANVTTAGGGSGSVTLVVDNAFPAPPDKGPGAFILDAGATLTAADKMRIFTSERTQNSINADINGAPFVPGTFLENTATEQWGVYFFDSFGGVPFTIFYKPEVVPIIIINQNTYGAVVIGDAERRLRDYGNFEYDIIPFCLEYDPCVDQEIFSSYTLLGDGCFQMLRPLYKNFHVRYAKEVY